MRKPIDPRNNGLKEPKSVIRENHSLNLSRLEEYQRGDSLYGRRVRLHAVVGAWEKAYKDHASQGHRMVEGPWIDGGLNISYVVEWDNLNHPAEKAEYDAAIASYEAEKETFIKWEAEEKSKPPSLEKKIERAKQRLANLEAARDGQPLPFPEP